MHRLVHSSWHRFRRSVETTRRPRLNHSQASGHGLAIDRSGGSPHGHKRDSTAAGSAIPVSTATPKRSSADTGYPKR